MLRGLQALVAPAELVVVVNTADDDEFHGLHISPDVDTVLYTLAGRVDPRQGWGLRGDSFACLDALRRLEVPTWFRLGDRDLATHVVRTQLLRRGATLAEVTERLRRALGVDVTVLPMTNDRVRTFVTVAGRGELAFQEYLVRDHAAGEVTAIRQRGSARARPAPGVLEAIQTADRILLPPSNPFVSIGPILALRGVRAALRRARARTVAVSPIVGGMPVKGPLDRMLRGLGHEVSAVGVARLYQGLVGTYVLDRRDAAEAERVRALGMQPVVTDTMMTSPARARRLAAAVLAAITPEPRGRR